MAMMYPESDRRYQSSDPNQGPCQHSHRTPETAARCAWRRSGLTVAGAKISAVVVRADGKDLTDQERSRVERALDRESQRA